MRYITTAESEVQRRQLAENTGQHCARSTTLTHTRCYHGDTTWDGVSGAIVTGIFPINNYEISSSGVLSRHPIRTHRVAIRTAINEKHTVECGHECCEIYRHVRGYVVGTVALWEGVILCRSLRRPWNRPRRVKKLGDPREIIRLLPWSRPAAGGAQYAADATERDRTQTRLTAKTAWSALARYNRPSLWR